LIAEVKCYTSCFEDGGRGYKLRNVRTIALGPGKGKGMAFPPEPLERVWAP